MPKPAVFTILRRILEAENRSTTEEMGNHPAGKESTMRTRSMKTVPDSSWKSLYRAGSISTAIALAMYLGAFALIFVTEAAPTSGAADMLAYIDDNRGVYVVKQVLWIMPSLFLMVTFLALTVALWDVDKSHALIAGLVGIVSWAGAFSWPTSGEGSLVLLHISDRYADAVSDAERSVFLGAAETMIAYNDAPAFLGVLQTIGILLMSLVMLRGVFSKGLAWLGVLAGGIGVASEALRPWMGWGYAIYGLLLFVWLGWVAWELWTLYRGSEARLAGEPGGMTEGAPNVVE
jgi:hypothetical protein